MIRRGPSLLLLTSLIAAANGLSATEPCHRWTFDTLDWDTHCVSDTGSAKDHRLMTGRIATGQGRWGSDALRADSNGGGTVPNLGLSLHGCTFDCWLRFSTPPQGIRTVFDYQAGAAGGANLNVAFDSGRLAVRLGKVLTTSQKLGLSVGQVYSLRVSLGEKGRLRVWLDGKPVIDRRGFALPPVASDGLKRDEQLCVGGRGGSEALDGVIDDFTVYDRMLGAPEADKMDEDYAHVVRPEYREVSGEGCAEVLVLDRNGTAVTAPFHVADKMDDTVFGQMNAADARFVKAASTATTTVSDGHISITVECPVPSGMTVAHDDDLWSGDYVFVQLRAKPTDAHYYGYCINASGAHAEFCGGRAGWTSHAAVNKTDTANGYRVSVRIPYEDVFERPPAPGDAFGVNVTRYGQTCGGMSAWAVAGGAFNDARWAFGTVVFGGAKDYFLRRLADLRNRTESYAKGSSALQAVATACASVRTAIVRHADEPNGFASLERMFGDLEKSLLAITLRGRPLLAFEPVNVWGNDPSPRIGTRPLELIRLKTPQNMRTVKGLAVANFRQEAFVGSVKFFDRYDGLTRTGEDWPLPDNRLAPRFTVRKALELRGRDRRPLYDAIAELPLGSLLEIAPGATTPLFVELDTQGVAPGRYYLLLLLHSHIPGFADARIAVEVTVTADDLNELPSDRIGYTHLATSFGAGGKRVVRPAVNCVRRLVSRGYNVVLLSRFDDLLPTRAADGTWKRPSYEATDRYIDAWLAGGLDRRKIKLQPYLGVEREFDCWKGLRDASGQRVPFGTSEYDKGIVCLVKSFVEHVKKRYDIGRDRIIWYPVDEANGSVDDPQFKSTASRCMHVGRLIRNESRANVIMWNPLPHFLGTESFKQSQKAFADIFDIIELYRPKVTPDVVRNVHSSGIKTVWSYHVTSRDGTPEMYRGPVWQNLRDGFSESVAYWHMDESATLDPGCSYTYGTLYVDWDRDDLMLTRRQLAADMGAEEGRLVNYLRLRAKNRPEKLSRIEALVKEGADGGTMAAMDKALGRLLDEL